MSIQPEEFGTLWSRADFRRAGPKAFFEVSRTVVFVCCAAPSHQAPQTTRVLIAEWIDMCGFPSMDRLCPSDTPAGIFCMKRHPPRNALLADHA